MRERRLNVKLTWILIGFLPCVSLSAIASDIKVIANSHLKVSQVSADDLKSIFLVTKTSLTSSGHIEPVLLKSGAAHQAFVRQYIGKTAPTLENYYRSLVFTGKGAMPKMLSSDEEVVEYVAKTKGAIGYVSAGANTADVKILEVK
jgi:ABC-type phosphate transport system substrate-binding protein